VIDRLIAAVRDLLRKMGVTLQLSDKDVRALIARAARALRGSSAAVNADALAGLSAASSDEQITAALDNMPAGAELDGGLYLDNELKFLRESYADADNAPPWVQTRIAQIEDAIESRDRDAFTTWIDLQGNLAGGMDRALAPMFRAPDYIESAEARAANLKKWAGDSKLVDNSGMPLRVLHGTTHDFSRFSAKDGNPENYYGRMHYFTSNPADASKNYAGIGPDLEHQIDKETDKIFWADGNNALLDAALQISRDDETLKKFHAKRSEARELALKRLAGPHRGAIYPAYVKASNPVYVGTLASTDFFQETRFDTQAKYNRLRRAVLKTAQQYNVPQNETPISYFGDRRPRSAIEKLDARFFDHREEITAAEVEDVLRGDLSLAGLSDDNGKSISNEFVRDVWKNAGFDAIVLDAGGRFPGMTTRGTRHYMVFKSSQVKSATGNAGTFNVRSPNILYSRAAQVAPDLQAAMDRIMSPTPESLTIKDKVRTTWQKLRNIELLNLKQGMIDEFASIEDLERKFNDGKLQDAQRSAYKAALSTKNLSSVMAAVMLRGIPVFRNGAYQVASGRKGFVEIFSPIMHHRDGNLLRQWEFFAAANRAKRLKTETNRDGSSREKLFTDADIALGLSLEQKYPEFRAALNDWAALNKQTLDLAEEAGVLDPESRKIWENNDYVPFYRAMEDTREGPTNTATLANQRARIKTLQGSEKQIGNIFENMTMNTAHLLDASFKNRAMAGIVELAEDVAMEKVDLPWEAIKFTNAQIASALRRAGVLVGNVDDDTGVVERMTKEQRESWSTLFRKVAPRGPDIVSVMVAGKPVYYRVTDPLLLRAVGGLGQRQVDGLVTAMFRGSKHLLTGAITADPAFMLANFVRDTLSTWVQSDASMKPVVDAVKGLKAAWQEDEAMLNIMMSGAGGGGFYDASPANIRKLVSEKLPADKVDGFMKTVITPKSAWRLWRKIGAASENANRIAVFKAVLAKGGSVAEAAYQARDVLNFSMRGDFAAMRWLTETVPFMNARIQGLYRLPVLDECARDLTSAMPV
jgi:hypothetical protein